jgi:hypothetical protein
MGPLFVLFAWMIVGIIVLSIYFVLHFIGKKSPVALQLKSVMPAFVLAIFVPLAILAIINILKIVFFE